MELLDLTIHDPEEFEGKLVIYNDCEYIVGPHLGTGAEKIVHKFINRRSGLCLHVIKFWRSEESGEIGSRHELAAKTISNLLGMDTVPDIIETSAHGGRFALQTYIGPYEEESNQAHKFMENADQLMKSSRIIEAISMYEEALKINRYHTVALNNLAYAHGKLDNFGKAFKIQLEAVEIEPNYLSYQKSLIEYAAACGQLRTSLSRYKRMKSMFRYEYSVDELAINICLEMGKPEQAKYILDECILDQKRKKELEEAIGTALLSKQQSSKYISEAKGIILTGKLEGILELLEKAYSIYDKDPLLAINLAFALNRKGEFHRAKQLLLSVIFKVDFSIIKLCYINAAFSAIKGENLQEAVKLLGATMYHIKLESEDNKTIDIGTLPSIGIWIDEEGSLEEMLDSSLVLINHAVQHYTQNEEMSDFAKALVRLYAEAAHYQSKNT